MRFFPILSSVAWANYVLGQSYLNASTSAVPSSTTIDGTAVANPSAFVTNLQLSVEGNLIIALPACRSGPQKLKRCRCLEFLCWSGRYCKHHDYC
jgi:hypothetical protein